jgi:predicted dienelactone hydrolase
MKSFKIGLFLVLSFFLVSVAQAVQIGPDPTDAVVNANGPFAISSLAVAKSSSIGFGGGTIYYPSTAGSYGVIALCPGFTNTQTSLAKVAQRIASHGFVVLNMNTNSTLDFPPVRATQQQAAVKYMKTGVTNSTVKARMDLNRIGVAGYSMGGGATLITTSTDSSYKVGIPMAPYRTSTDMAKTIKVPEVILGGEKDTVAPVSSMAQVFYNNIPGTTPKVLGVLTGADHMVYISSTIDERVGRYTVVAAKRFLDGDTRYSTFLSGDAATAYNTSARFTSYTSNGPF